jgi:outer membrane protein TolC
MKFLTGILIFVTCNLYALTLQEATEALHKNNTTLAIFKQQIDKSNQKYEQKNAQLYGSFDAVSSLTKYNEKRTLAPLAPPISPNVPTSDTLTNIGVQYGVTLFSGFKDSSQMELSSLATQIEKTKYTLNKSQLEFTLQSLFCDISSLQKNLLASKEYQKALEKIYDFTKHEYDLGKKSQLELLKIEADLEESKSGLIEVETKIDILKYALSILVYGEKKDFEIEDLEEKNSTVELNVENLLKVKLANLGKKSKEKSLQSTQSAYYPKITFNTSYNDIYGDGEKENITTASLNLSWKLYDFGTRESQVQEAKIEQIEAKLELQKTKEELLQTIYEAQKNIEKNEQLLKSATANLQVAKKTKEIEEIMYKEGQKDIADYLLSMAKFAQSEAKLITTHYALLKSKYYFYSITKE